MQPLRAVRTYAHNRFEVPIDPSVQPLAPGETSRPPDPFGNDSPPFVPHDTNATETEDELFAAVSFTHKFDDGKNGQLQIAPLYKLSRGVLFSDPIHALGALADPGSTASNVTRDAQHAGGVAAYSLQRGGHSMKFGVQTDALLGRTSFASFVRDDGDGGGIDASMTGGGTDKTDAITSGAYGQDHWVSGKLALDFGLRVDEMHVIPGDQAAHDDVGVSPRLGASLGLGKDVVLHAFTGVLWQPPAPLDAGERRARARRRAGRRRGAVRPRARDRPLRGARRRREARVAAARLARDVGPLRVRPARRHGDRLDEPALELQLQPRARGRPRGDARPARRAVAVGVRERLAVGSRRARASRRRSICSRRTSSPTRAGRRSTTRRRWTANAGATVRDKRFVATAVMAYGSGLRTGSDNNDHVPGHVTVDTTMAYTFTPHAYPIRVAVDVVNLFDDHYAFRIANGFVGSSFGAPRSVFLSLSIPFAPEPHHEGE